MSRKGIRGALGLGRHESTSGIGLVALAAGVIVGLAAGAYLADRLGGLAGIRSRLGGRLRSAMPSRPRSVADKRQDESHAEVDEEEDAEELESYDEEYEDADFESADEALEERVLEAFNNDPVLSERAVDIGAVEAGVIELTGWVYAPEEIEHAATLARGVPGVETVVNQLTVRGDEHADLNTEALRDAVDETGRIAEGLAGRGRPPRTDQERSAP